MFTLLQIIQAANKKKTRKSFFSPLELLNIPRNGMKTGTWMKGPRLPSRAIGDVALNQ